MIKSANKARKSAKISGIVGLVSIVALFVLGYLPFIFWGEGTMKEESKNMVGYIELKVDELVLATDDFEKADSKDKQIEIVKEVSDICYSLRSTQTVYNKDVFKYYGDDFKESYWDISDSCVQLETTMWSSIIGELTYKELISENSASSYFEVFSESNGELLVQELSDSRDSLSDMWQGIFRVIQIVFLGYLFLHNLNGNNVSRMLYSNRLLLLLNKKKAFSEESAINLSSKEIEEIRDEIDDNDRVYSSYDIKQTEDGRYYKKFGKYSGLYMLSVIVIIPIVVFIIVKVLF